MLSATGIFWKHIKMRGKKTFIPRCQRLETTCTIPHFSQNRKIERKKKKKKKKTENKNRCLEAHGGGEGGVLIWYSIDLTIKTATIYPSPTY